MKEVLLKKVGIGLVLYVIFNIVLFGLAMIFGFEDSNTGPTLLSSLVFCVLIGLIFFGFLKWMKPKSQKEAFYYSFSWTAVVFAILLVVTIGNKTTGIFFGKWFNWLPFVAMAASPFMLQLSTKKNP